jgi:hypothetical protein
MVLFHFEIRLVDLFICDKLVLCIQIKFSFSFPSSYIWFVVYDVHQYYTVAILLIFTCYYKWQLCALLS